MSKLDRIILEEVQERINTFVEMVFNNENHCAHCRFIYTGCAGDPLKRGECLDNWKEYLRLGHDYSDMEGYACDD